MTFPLSYSDKRKEDAQNLLDIYGFVHNDIELPRLHLNDERLELLSKDFKPITVDFNNYSLLKRAQQGKNQGLVKACKPHNGLKIIDATAGFGQDAFILASFGAEVTMLERCPMLVALLRDGLLRLEQEDEEFVKLNLIQTDSLDYIANLKTEDFPDIIYLDPMHPTRKKRALVKKEMQVLQSILGFDVDVKKLLNVAIPRCRKSVIIKWPQKEPPLLEPHHSIIGKTVRFDVYVP